MLQLVANRMVSETTLCALLPEHSQRLIEPEKMRALQAFQEKLDEVERLSFGNELTQLRLLEITMDRQHLAYYNVARTNAEFRRLMKLLLSIPGVGPDTAATILAEIADISYFPRPVQLAKWAGLAPRVHQSGHHKHVTGHIHKGGNKYLRRALVLACQNIYAKGTPANPLYRFMRAKKEQRDSYWLALCAGARKLLVIIWHMLKKEFEWGKINPDIEVLEPVKRTISQKIKLFQSKLKRYQKIEEMLSGRCENLLKVFL